MVKILRGLRVQSRNIRALMLRDMMVRYGRNNIGFTWVILEPMILTAGVMLFWSLTAGSTKLGVKVVEFVLTGYMPLTLWRHLSSTGVMLFRRSAPLLYHNSISVFDLVFAKALLEFIGTSIAFLVVWGILNVSGVVADISRVDLLVLGWLMMAWLATAFGLILAALTEYSETSERFIQPFQYLSIPVSGAFTMVDWLPQWGQDAILLNPMVHCYEVFRAGYFGPGVVTHFSYAYFSSWAYALTFIGIVVVHRTRARVQLN
jgi:capsular polysaccharide transport system permease protein